MIITFYQNQRKTFIVSDLDKHRILLVEDNLGDVRLTREAMKESGIMLEMDVVSNGEQALDFLMRRPPYENANRPSLILLDLNLPKRNGAEVLKEIKGLPALQTIPVVMLTTSDAEHDIDNCYQLGVNCYIIKPVDFDEFSEIFKNILQFWFKSVRLPVR